jgi:hypothetical protein
MVDLLRIETDCASFPLCDIHIVTGDFLLRRLLTHARKESKVHAVVIRSFNINLEGKNGGYDQEYNS